MLDSNDKKWIRETIDERLDERFDAFETRFMLLMENVLSSRL